jgi:hypothetical protein
MGAEGWTDKIEAEKHRRAVEEVQAVKVEQYAEAAAEAEEPVEEPGYLGFKDGKFQ